MIHMIWSIEQMRGGLRRMSHRPPASHGACDRLSACEYFLHMGRAARESENIVGTNIRAARFSRSMTQAELSEQIGITIESLSRAERGTILPTVNTLAKLATVLGTTIDALAGRTHARELTAVRSLRPRPAADADRSRLLRIIDGLEQNSVRKLLAIAELLPHK
jgi:transcriptional regulator with XRE-family HTH domain